MSLTVLDPGLASRIVDFGRPRSRSLGVPVGGAADRASLVLGNALVGNSPDAPALEICLKGPTLRADEPVAGVVFGAPFPISSARQTLTTGTTFTLKAGEEIHIGSPPIGLRACLCVVGGFDHPSILGSRSSLENIAVGSPLQCRPGCIRRRYFLPHGMPSARAVGERPNGHALHVVVGLQASWFDEHEFYGQEFTITPALDRMGVRLKGRALSVPDRELVSEAVGPGAVQVTRDGQCIVLGVDGQTIGGYPKIAQVVQCDLDMLGQLRPGEHVRFVKITIEKAAQRYRASQTWLREWVTRLRVSLAGF